MLEGAFQISVTVCWFEDGARGAAATPEKLMVRVVPVELASVKEPELFPAAIG